MTKYEPYPAGETPKVGDRVRVTYVEEGLVEHSSGVYLSLPITMWNTDQPGLTIERAIPEKPTFQEAFAALEVGDYFVIDYAPGRIGQIQQKSGTTSAKWIHGGDSFDNSSQINDIYGLKRITIEED